MALSETIRAASPAGTPAGPGRPALPPELRQRVAPVTLSGERLLEVPEPLRPLLPGGGLQRGATVSVAGTAGACGATSLALALAARVSATGSWAVAVGLPALGLVAAHELGLPLTRFPQVATPPGSSWGPVVAALVDGFDVVVVGAGRVRERDARRLAARARERGTVLVPVGGGWPEGADVSLTVTASRWEGPEQGAGHLRSRRVEVVAAGRRGAARERRAWLWLPHPDGGVRAAEAPTGREALATVHRLGRRRRAG